MPTTCVAENGDSLGCWRREWDSKYKYGLGSRSPGFLFFLNPIRLSWT